MRCTTAGRIPITRLQADVLTALVLTDTPLSASEISDQTGLLLARIDAALLALTARGSVRRARPALAEVARYKAI